MGRGPRGRLVLPLTLGFASDLSRATCLRRTPAFTFWEQSVVAIDLDTLVERVLIPASQLPPLGLDVSMRLGVKTPPPVSRIERAKSGVRTVKRREGPKLVFDPDGVDAVWVRRQLTGETSLTSLIRLDLVTGDQAVLLDGTRARVDCIHLYAGLQFPGMPRRETATC